MSSSSTVKDLTAGTVGGIAQVLVGQPFDIVKVVRLQSLSLSPLLATRFYLFSFPFLTESPRLTRFLSTFQRDRPTFDKTQKKKPPPPPPGKTESGTLEDANCCTGNIHWHGTLCHRYLEE